MNFQNHCKKAIYYFDRIVINTSIQPHNLKNAIPVKKLEKLCGKLWIGETSNIAKYSGYRSKIDAKDVSDKFIEILSKYDLAKYGISYIEITKDMLFDSFKQAEDYQFWFERNIYRRWERNRFQYLTTDYIAKKKGKKADHYLVMYLKPVNKYGEKSVFHIEFRLKNWAAIKRILRISELSELGTARDNCISLENRYLAEKKLNRERIKKALIKLKVNPAIAEKRTYGFSDIQDFREWLQVRKSQVAHKIRIRPLNRKMKGKCRNLTTFDKKIMGWSVGYFLTDLKNSLTVTTYEDQTDKDNSSKLLNFINKFFKNPQGSF